MDKKLNRSLSSNPHDHGMVVDGLIEGVPGMAAWRFRTNDEWMDLKEDLEKKLAYNKERAKTALLCWGANAKGDAYECVLDIADPLINGVRESKIKNL